MTADRAAFVRRRVRSAGTSDSWGIAVETPIEIGINGVPWTVMLATPADLEDLAVGLAFTERVIDDAAVVEGVAVSDYLEGIAVNLSVPGRHVDEAARRSRLLEGRTGCGLCGVASLAELRQRPSGVVRPSAPVAMSAIESAFASLPTVQPLNQATRSVHGAAWCTSDGRIELAREDVGRHNALDKVIGAVVRRHARDRAGFVVMTSRCSFELVYKAAAAGASMLATISAPTSLALEWADALGLPLACRGPAGEIVLFDPEPHRAEG